MDSSLTTSYCYTAMVIITTYLLLNLILTQPLKPMRKCVNADWPAQGNPPHEPSLCFPHKSMFDQVYRKDTPSLPALLQTRRSFEYSPPPLNHSHSDPVHGLCQSGSFLALLRGLPQRNQRKRKHGKGLSSDSAPILAGKVTRSGVDSIPIGTSAG